MTKDPLDIFIYLVQELCDIIDLVVENDPDGSVRALANLVLLHLTQTERFGHVSD